MKMLCAITLVLFTLGALADDVADVNATADRFQTAFNENSAEATALFMAQSALAYLDPVPVLNDGKEALKQFFAGQFGFTEWVKLLPTGPRTTRVTGSTAVIGQSTVFFWKPQDGGAESMYVNTMQVWTKVGEEWLLTGIMTSALPHGTTP